MQDKTSRINQAMRSQTFGVEVEMSQISRKAAAQLAARYFGTNRTEYAGTYYDVYVAIDAQGRKWKFETDGSIRGGRENQCEMVTPILTYGDIELLQGLLRELRKAGAKSDPTWGCGVHIHVGLNSNDGLNHTPATLRNLANLMKSHELQLVRACGIEEARLDHWCQVVDQRFLDRLNRERPSTMDALENLWYDTQAPYEDRSQHYNSSRYHMLNYHACFTKGTIEFRCFNFQAPVVGGRKGGIHAGELKTWIQLVLAMSAMAKLQRSCSPRPQQTENEKYAFRCWLLRLGFIGDEFATAREILLRNLEGNAAWRQAG